jgi:transcriptional regulator with XRE-family HTH domain
VITNERQYRITKSWLERFEQARASGEEQNAHLPARAQQALRDQYDSQIDELRAELAEYDALRLGQVAVLELDSLNELPDALIRARAASGLSQEALAGRLGLKKQQVQRYEATRYSGVGVGRLQAVADALGVKIHERVVLPTPDASSGGGTTIAEPHLAGLLVRRGLTHDDLARRLCVPPSLTLKLQRGRIDPETVPDSLLDKLGDAVGVDAAEARRVVSSGAPERRPIHARGGAPRKETTINEPRAPKEVAGGLVSFRDALTSAPDLTDEHRRAWLETEGRE